MSDNDDRERLQAALDGELDPEQRQLLLNDLQQDADLTQDLRTLLQAEHLLHQLHHAHDGFSERVLLAQGAAAFSDQVVDRWQGRRRSRLYGAAGLLAAGLVIGILVLTVSHPQELPWDLAQRSGTVLVGAPGQWRMLEADEPLLHGERLRIGGDASIQLQHRQDGIQLELLPDTRITFHDQSAKHIHIDQGGLLAQVDRQDAHDPLVLEAAAARCTVLGTSFQLRLQAGEAQLQVVDGTVQVEHGSQTMAIGAAESLTWTPKRPADPYRLVTRAALLKHDWRGQLPTPWSAGRPDPVAGLTRGQFSKIDDRGVRLVGIRGAGPWPKGFGRVEVDDRLQLELRLRERSSFVVVMVGSMTQDGRFHMASHTFGKLDRDWQVLDLPRSWLGQEPPPVGDRYILYLVIAPEDAGLELREFLILRQERVGTDF
jgi:hypothetical protein